MVASINFTQELRAQLYNLNLLYQKHREIYENLLFNFIKENEGEKLQVYHDSKKYKTIGIGFNMDSPTAKKTWQQIFNGFLPFDEVYHGRNITISQSRKIYTYVIANNRTELQYIYYNYWHRLKANELVMIEDLYWNGSSKLVGIRTNFYHNIVNFAITADKKYLEKALTEVKLYSNRENSKGIQNRRNAQYEMGSPISVSKLV